MSWTLGELSQRFDLELRGDAQRPILRLCSLDPGAEDGLGFLADPRHRKALAATRCAAVLLRASDAEAFTGNALIAADPALAFARIAALYDDSLHIAAGRDPSACVDAQAGVSASAWIGPNAVIEAGAAIGERVFVGPGCVVRAGAVVGDDSRLEANVYVAPRCRLGARCHVQPGAVIGGRGFGLARSREGWVEMPQLGVVVIGDDVEIGANTTIDRGALEDTVIGSGAKLDNQIQIAHNCRIGEHTAIAACVGIAGSTRIGARCMIGGAAGIGGHLEIGDDIVVLGRAMVTKSLTAPGVYGSGLPVMPAREWRRLVSRIRRLQPLEARLEEIEKQLKLDSAAKGESGERSDDDAL